MHKPDYSKDRFQIIITVNENCQKIDVATHDGYKPTYQEFIGAMQICLMRYVFNQSGLNIEEFYKWKAENKTDKSKKEKQDGAE